MNESEMLVQLLRIWRYQSLGLSADKECAQDFVDTVFSVILEGIEEGIVREIGEGELIIDLIKKCGVVLGKYGEWFVPADGWIDACKGKEPFSVIFKDDRSFSHFIFGKASACMAKFDIVSRCYLN